MPDHQVDDDSAAYPPVVTPLAVAPSSYAQRRLWLLDQLYGQRATYNVPSAYRLTGPLDLARLQRSLNDVVRRHEVLRTVFRFEHADLSQVILPAFDVPIVTSDLSNLPLDERFDAAMRDVHHEAAHPFDLAAPPLIRVRLYRLGADDHLLSVNIHHAVYDGWSETLFIDELAAGYERAAGDRSGEGEPLATQYRDFAVWQRAQIATAEVQASLAAWRARLSGAPTRLNLPFDHARPATPSGRGGRVVRSLSPAMVDALRGVGRRRGATLFMTLLTAYSVVLHRYSSDREVMIGTALAGRTRPELEGLIGFFVNTVALRVDLDGDPTFVEMLQRIRQVSLDAQVHQDVPFDAVVESLHPERSAGPMPFFQTMFVMENVGGARPFADLGLVPVPVNSGTAKCDLVLGVASVRDGSGGLECTLDFDADLFGAETAARLLDSYRSVLEGVAADPEQSILSLPVVGHADRAQLERWSDTPSAYKRTQSIHGEFSAIAARMPHAVAVVGVAHSLTYSALEARANRVAARLRREGVQHGDLVALAFDRTPDAIVAQLAVLKTGAAYLPVDVTEPASRVTLLLQDARVRITLSDRASSQRLPQGVARSVVLEGDGELHSDDVGPDACEGHPDDLAYVMFTSGSTGRPNGVRIPHRGVLRLVLGGDYVDWNRATTFLQMAPLTFDASTFEIWGALLHGRRLVMFPERVPTIATLEAILQRERIDCLWLTSALFNSVIDERPECLSAVSQLLVGGEALSVAHVRRAQQQLPATQIINGYGPTECTTFACCYSIPALDDRLVDSIPIGRPIGGTRVAVLDPQQQLVPVGVVGELYIGGDGVALGYHERPRATAERFVADPTGQSGRLWYRTGDRVRWTGEGVLEFHGRLDAQLKLRGFRVEPGEIESACRQCPGVRDAAVVLDPAASGGQLVAFVIGDGAAPDPIVVKAWLAERLPGYMQPTAVVPIDVFPLTANGKVDRQTLVARRYVLGGTTALRTAGAPRTATEATLVQLWRDLLQCEVVGIHDDFFALGGHSLLAVRMFAQIATRLGRHLPFSTLLSHGSIASLATLLDQPVAGNARSVSLVPLQVGGDRPPLLLLHGIGNEVWGFRELVACVGPGQPVFGVVASDHAALDASSLVERAARYVADLEILFPEGPLTLGGHCSGAVIAFEMARQLRSRGRDVPLLIVFDYCLEEEAVGIRARATNFASWITDDLLASPLSHNLGRIRSRSRLLMARWFSRSDHGAPRGDVRDRLGLWRLPAREVVRLERHLESFAAYRFECYGGRTVVFRARTRALTRTQPTADLGWRRVVSGALTVETVPGAHDTMLRTPFVARLGERVSVALGNACSSDTPRQASRETHAPTTVMAMAGRDD